MASLIDEQQLSTLGARRIAIDTDPDELILPEEAQRRLAWIAGWLCQPPFIFREWGLSRFVDGGFRALFRGPSGTGKTMAAVALAKQTGFELLRIDLAAIDSKYVADTEKNLQQLFRATEDSRTILLFDEADALLARRGEAKDAHDRYANLEITLLLQKLERFEGLAILATNHCPDLDQSALGRIDVIVDFPRPDEAAREALWRRLLGTVKLGQVDDVDFRSLAGGFDLTGAEILRAVRMAALLAAEDARDIDMGLLKCAAEERVRMQQPS
ncbi:ATP-binding protein [Sphingomonas sp. RB56-2]|uniref:ATP-binding protein n=1 Tax=Sphingomonas brevis TaxID=2908206 RepID=A0ABT0SAU2_9SPHN|nr:ATP-binding protein [Sphingomonas brevis]MCL6741201.1 ATP-binding protein [Sphingomonas brevis]